MSRVIALDFETFYGKDFSVVDLGYWRYTRDPRCDIYMISVSDGTENWSGHPKDFNFDSLEDATLLSHNAAFDEEVALAAAERGLFKFPRLAGWHCTANMAAYLWNRRSLAEATLVGLGVHVDKGVRDRAKDKTWEDMIREGWSEDMLRYARLDAQHCFHLWEKHSHKWPDWERRLSKLTIEQGRYGVRIDVPRLEAYIEKLNAVIFVAQQNLPWIARGRVPGSTLGVAEECRANNIPCPPVKAHDPEAAAEWEEKYAPQFKWVMALRNLRKAKKTLATLETIKLRLRPDGTVAFSLKYFGAHTGRWSGDAGWNLQNMNKEPLWIDLGSGFFELNEPTLKVLNKIFDGAPTNITLERVAPVKPGPEYYPVDMRGLIIARTGMKLAPTDLAQIEPRVENHLVGNKPLLARISAGMAIYEAFARDSMGWAGGDLKTEDKKKYQLAKIQVLGLGYGCGWAKFITIAASKPYEMDLTEEDDKYALLAAVDGKIHQRYKVFDGKLAGEWEYLSAPETAKVALRDEARPLEELASLEVQRVIFVEKINYRTQEKTLQVQTVYGQQSRAIVKAFRESNPLIVGLWNEMEAQLRGAVGGDLVIELPSGRCLTYGNVRKEIRKFIDPDTEEKTERQCYTAEIGGRRYVLYGGLIAENVTQAVARDVFAHNMLLVEDAGIRTLFTVHDEDVPEVPEDFDSAIITRIMSTTPSWLEGCPVGAETKDTQRYLK